MNIPEGATPPHSLDAEAAVLSAAVLDPSAMGRLILIGLTPEEFYSEAHRRIFEACSDLHSRGQPVDVVQVGGWLRDRQRLAQIGGLQYLTDMINAVPAISNVESYARMVREKARVRDLAATCQRISAECYGDYGAADKFIDRAEQAIYAISRQTVSRARLEPMGSIMRTRFVEWQKAYDEGKTKAVGIPTGFDRLDRVTAGWHDGDLTVLAARPGMGKSAMALEMATRVAHTSGTIDDKTVDYVAAFFAMEMPKGQLADRALCSWAEVDLRLARTGEFNPQAFAALTQAVMEGVATDRLLVCDKAGITIPEARALLREAIANEARKGRALKLAVFDYLQLCRAHEVTGSRQEDVAMVARGLKDLAMDLNIAVLALSQLNRSCETRTDKRPGLADLRESGEIENAADNVILLYRDEYYNPETKDRGVVEVDVGKQRNGPTGVVKVGFWSSYTKFYELPEDYETGAAPHPKRAALPPPPPPVAAPPPTRDWHEREDD